MPPGAADRGDDVTAMAEREDRELEAQLPGELRAHDADRTVARAANLQHVLGSGYGAAVTVGRPQ